MADRHGMRTSAEEARLRHRSAVLAAFCTGIAVALPALVLVVWVTGGITSGAESLGSFLPAAGMAARAAVLVLTLTPALLLTAGFLAARRMLRAFATGRWFEPGTVRALAAFGRWTALAGLAGVLVPTLVGLVLSVGAPPGARTLVVSIGSGPVLAMLIGAVIWTLGRVWARAAQLRADLDGFV